MSHAIAVACSSDPDTSLNNISEHFLVKKADITLELAQKEDNETLPPSGAKFLSI
ncbi:hypothetical protein SCLCIDRAFT_34709 [Scleroderma citrinum Foug A]|uniref:Uncharacterized protein n=1 Tax=Scleroderma citrinum Foug A TaxID=1036808 RepID=A0A0C2YJY0_9AGAM|nr:hypothetical protein SCLCIDRAFT_34709 [Scleroderma citrinum Foug A]